jgi:uncharacterized protein
MNRITGIFLALLLFFLLDLYVFQAVRTVTERRGIYWLYWIISGISLVGFAVYWLLSPNVLPREIRNLMAGFFFVNFAAKFLTVIFVFADDIGRGVRWLVQKAYSGSSHDSPEGVLNDTVTTSPPISRSEFLMKTALIAGAIPAVGLTFGILSGAHDYRIRKRTVFLKNLPAAFDGIKIGQLSDIHSGSFYNKKAVIGGVEMLLREKPDVVFFTGDLVNNETSEVRDYQEVFEKVKAPMGVFSTLGNHDYGDYRQWETPQAKRQNLLDIIRVHQQMGWDLLMNQHRILQTVNEKIAILGVENYGKGRFPKYGKLAQAHDGTEDFPVKLLLSHDPSHWDLQILDRFKDIDLTFSGHTHGMQFGVEIGDWRWSPAKWAYEQWADLYEKNGQYLYVNRGFGYIGYPGRVGILPEITIIELKKGNPA